MPPDRGFSKRIVAQRSQKGAGRAGQPSSWGNRPRLAIRTSIKGTRNLSPGLLPGNSHSTGGGSPRVQSHRFFTSEVPVRSLPLKSRSDPFCLGRTFWKTRDLDWVIPMVPCYLTALVSEPSGGKKTGGESLLLLVARGVPRPMANSFADGRGFPGTDCTYPGHFPPRPAAVSWNFLIERRIFGGGRSGRRIVLLFQAMKQHIWGRSPGFLVTGESFSNRGESFTLGKAKHRTSWRREGNSGEGESPGRKITHLPLFLEADCPRVFLVFKRARGSLRVRPG